MITVGSLFAGIGGLELGLERTGGFVTKWQVEIDDYATRVLEKHWPDVRRWRDVRTFPPEGDWSCDLICGGFPCQDISNAGKRAGIEGARSGLFFEVVRVARLLRPRMLLLENVAALLHRGMGTVLGELSSLGFDAEWHCIPAAAVGAPHIRDRVFIIGTNWDANGCDEHTKRRVCEGQDTEPGGSGDVSYASSVGRNARGTECQGQQRETAPVEHCSPLSDALRTLLESGAGGRGVRQGDTELADASGKLSRHGHNGTCEIVARQASGDERKWKAVSDTNYWHVEPDVGRVAHGVPARVDRLRCLGNAVVPQVAELIGRAILTADDFNAQGVGGET